jgi:hypothetical protein
VSTALYAVPRTAFLGAILLTGYLGGAVATQVRVEDPWFLFPAFFGVLVWGGLFLRDERVRALVRGEAQGAGRALRSPVEPPPAVRQGHTSEKTERGEAMRKVVAAEFLSLDGVMESPDKWHFPYFNEEMGQAVGEGFASADAMLMGRVNYEEWAAFWPGQDPQENPFAAQMNSMQKYVVSTTLEEPLEWQNSTLIARTSRTR